MKPSPRFVPINYADIYGFQADDTFMNMYGAETLKELEDGDKKTQGR